MADSNDEQKRAQQERARQLTDWIEHPEKHPKVPSPHEFIEEKMKELDKEHPAKPKKPGSPKP